jgi:hypothetical protein
VSPVATTALAAALTASSITLAIPDTNVLLSCTIVS